MIVEYRYFSLGHTFIYGWTWRIRTGYLAQKISALRKIYMKYLEFSGAFSATMGIL